MKSVQKALFSLLILLCVCPLAGCAGGQGSVSHEVSAGQSPVEHSMDCSEAFHGVNGCAVVFRPQENIVWLYQEDLCRQRVSPYSTFKIPATLLGLHAGVLVDETTTMDYSGIRYARQEWNHTLTLQEAVSSSCVWYFRQVIDRVGQQVVQEGLDALGYGNCDLSQWAGSGRNPRPELNGFWLDSSLRISPVEQVQVLASIMEGESAYTAAEIDILQSLLLTAETETETIYGKTGTGYDGQGWFVGFAKEADQRSYVTVYLDDSQNGGTGQLAKEIALDILSET